MGGVPALSRAEVCVWGVPALYRAEVCVGGCPCAVQLSQLDIKKEGRREGSEQNTCSSSRNTEFGSQHQHGRLQLRVTTVPWRPGGL